MTGQKCIVLDNGEFPRRILTVDSACKAFVVEHSERDGGGYTSYCYSGDRTDGGLELWKPRFWAKDREALFRDEPAS